MTKDPTLGAKLRDIRQGQGFTLRALAKKAGCSSSFISQVELNQASPTVSSLQKICSALGYTVSDFLREEKVLTQPVAQYYAADAPAAMRWYQARLKHVVSPELAPCFTMLILVLEPNGATPTRAAVRSKNELAFVLTGKVSLESGGKRIDLVRNDSAYFDLAQEHRWKNASDEPAEILLINAFPFKLFEQEEEDARWYHRSRRTLQARG